MRRTIKGVVVSGFVAALMWTGSVSLPRAAGQARVDFKREVEPILATSCYSCHGPKKAAGQLRLDVKALAMKGGISGASIVPGRSRESRLLARVRGEGGEARMPMGGEPLSPAQIETIRKWIDQGANWPDAGTTAGAGAAKELPKHWAYVKPVQPALPEVRTKAWVRNPIDAFILARLEREGLAPSPEAARETLLRRVALDITGLPPSPKEVDEFLADRSPDAYEKVVDRLLASPAYGERWARLWLDLARYADSNGYEKDNLRVAWKFRDWVIDALNRDMPFDQFTIEQLAGDMLPNATIEQKLATGFHRNTMVNQEGGIDPEENRFEVLVDRVNTTATVWLGSTMACAQCHNHKYDPFTQKDYYRLMAFFDNAEYQIAYQTPGADESRYILEPQLDLPTPEQEARRKTIDAEIKQLEAKLKTQTPALESEQAVWEAGLLAERDRWTTLDPAGLESSGGATLKRLDDKSVLASGEKAELDVYTIRTRTELKRITALRIEALPDASLPKGGPGRDPYGNFLLTGLEVTAANADGSGARTIALKEVAVDDSAYRIDQKPFLGREPAAVATDRPTGWFVNATGDAVRLPRQAVFVAETPFGFDAGTTLTIRLKHLGGSLNQGIGRFRLSIAEAEEPKRIVSLPARLRPTLSIGLAERTTKQREDLAAQFRAVTPLLKPERDRLERLRDDLKALNITTALVMQERLNFDRPATWFRERGSFLNRGDRVFAATPAVLPPLPENAPVNRLGLARWLVDENNPLTARVMVNRIWEALFGRGLVETSEDFGMQGERPSHPELLDWLAVAFGTMKDERGMMKETSSSVHPSSFRTQPWSLKHLIRTIVTSATYRQASSTTPALQEKDPYNRLLARGPRFRMEAEMVRDAALTASGLLTRRVGGPSVFPSQPDGVWKAPYSGEKWTTSRGEDRYRRSLYTFVRRSSPHPAMMTFDATSREYCTVRRVRTNTPLQALTMLNDDAAMEMARALARRMIEHGGDARTRLTAGFRLCVARAPSEKEIDRLLALYRDRAGYFAEREDEARKILKEENAAALNCTPAELAAWTMTANVLLNLDETLTKE
ncbi:MAG: PSD1 and planctomycete cytochrome C domain-containing protein [Blastocatellia bacterium]|nr:PSD1 and planctomycete cytochrome C domain-containing protein [Blastocatellia bacterium]